MSSEQAVRTDDAMPRVGMAARADPCPERLDRSALPYHIITVVGLGSNRGDLPSWGKNISSASVLKCKVYA